MSTMIRLKSAKLSPARGDSFLSIEAKVKNIEYHKDVRLHYKSNPFWQNAALSHEGHFGDYDIFRLTGGGNPLYTNEFVLSYEKAGFNYWDNNDCRNYLLNLEQTVVGGNIILNVAKTTINTGRLGSKASVKGEVFVNNRSYCKKVGIRYSLNGSGPWLDCDASYDGPIGLYGAEKWRFETPAILVNSSKDDYLKFALYYNNLESGEWYWDNNFFQDYKIALVNGAEIK